MGPLETYVVKSSTLRSILVAPCERFIAAEEGATAIEYAMIASGIGAAVATAVWGLGSSLKTNYYDAIAALF